MRVSDSIPIPHSRDRPAAIPVHVKHMADTSNFDEFEELNDQKKCELRIV